MWGQILSQVIRAAAGSEASTRQSDQIAVFDVVKKTKKMGDIKQVRFGCFSSIVSKLIIIQQCSDIWKRWKLKSSWTVRNKLLKCDKEWQIKLNQNCLVQKYLSVTFIQFNIGAHFGPMQVHSCNPGCNRCTQEQNMHHTNNKCGKQTGLFIHVAWMLHSKLFAGTHLAFFSASCLK